MLSKKKTILLLICITFLGSFVTFFGTNYLFHDLLDKGGDFYWTMPATFPMVSLAAMFVLGFFYVIRLYKRPKTFVELSRLYLLLGLIFSGVGFLTALLSGILVYGSFFKPYPFPGYLIIAMVLFAVLIWACVFCLIKLKGKESEETYHSKAGHIFSTLGWACFTILVFNRLGAFLLSPLYIQWRTLYLSFPFYFYLLCPLFIGVVKVLIDLQILTKGSRFILALVSGLVQLTFFAAVVFIGANNTEMIASISAAMPLERVSSLPVEIIIQFAGMTAVSIILIVQAVRTKNVKE